MSDLIYRLKYVKGDFEVELQGDREWVEKKFSELTNFPRANTESEQIEEKNSGVVELPKTLVEFLDLKGDQKTHPSMIAIFAYWLKEAEDIESFNVKDLEECYRSTGKTKPRNINDAINYNVKKQILSEEENKKNGLKSWRITKEGKKLVEAMKP